MDINDKKLSIISNFINNENTKISLENKGQSIFAFFKKSSKQSFINKLNDFVIKYTSKKMSKNDNFYFDLNKILNEYQEKDECNDKINAIRKLMDCSGPNSNDSTESKLKYYIENLESNILELKSKKYRKAGFLNFDTFYNDLKGYCWYIKGYLEKESEKNSNAITVEKKEIQEDFIRAISNLKNDREKFDIQKNINKLKSLNIANCFNKILHIMTESINEFIEIFEILFNGNEKITKCDHRIYEEIGTDIKTKKKEFAAKLVNVNEVKPTDKGINKRNNAIGKINLSSFKDFKQQISEIYDSLKKLKKVLPTFGIRSASKRTYKLLISKYNDIKSCIDSKDLNTKAQIISDNLNSVKDLIPSTISTRLIKKSRHFDDTSKINSALKDVYSEFSLLQKMLFGNPFEELRIQVDNNMKSIQSTSDGVNAIKLKYYINLVNSGMSKLKKYKPPILRSYLGLEKFHLNIKDAWKYINNLNIDKLKKNNNIKENIKINLEDLINQIRQMQENCENIDNFELETGKDLLTFNEYLNTLIDVTNDLIEVYEMLFTPGKYSKSEHINYSEIEGLHTEAYDEKNLKIKTVQDKKGKSITKYFAKRSGNHIQGKVIYSGFLFDYADVDLKEQIKNSPLNSEKNKKLLNDNLLNAFDKTKAGQYGVRIIATAEGLGGANLPPGIDDSYNIAEVSIVEISTKIINKNIKIRVYIACKAITIRQMLFGKNEKDWKSYGIGSGISAIYSLFKDQLDTILTVKNHLPPGNLNLISCNELDKFKDLKAKTKFKAAGILKKLKKCIENETNKKLKLDLENLLKNYEKSNDTLQFCIQGEKFINNANSTNYMDDDNKSIFNDLFELIPDLSEKRQQAESIKKMALDNIKRLEDPNWDPRNWNECGIFGWWGTSKEQKRDSIYDESIDKIAEAKKLLKQCKFSSLLKKYKNVVKNDDNTKENNIITENKTLNPKSVLGGEYLLASVPILKSNVNLSKGIIAQKESWMNPGKIWFTLDVSSTKFNDSIQETLKSKDQQNVYLNSSDFLACVSDIELVIDYAMQITVRVRLYVSLSKIVSSITKKMLSIKLKTLKGEIKLN